MGDVVESLEEDRTAVAAGSIPARCQDPDSTFFSTVWEDDAISIATASDGDLWASAWGPDDALYAANGDGADFSPISAESDIVVSRITGERDDLRGVSLVAVSRLGSIWSGSRYNRKPTGLVSADGVLYLARVPAKSVQNRAAWEFFAGLLPTGEPRWSREIGERNPVLHTERRVYQRTYVNTNMQDQTVLSQRSVVYNKPLRRYIYSSWTEYTHEFFEAPAPWGPWTFFYEKDFGMYPWSPIRHGGYTATIHSKFISADGKTMYVQDNTFSGGVKNYRFSLRTMRVEPRKPSRLRNAPDPHANLAQMPGVVPVTKTISAGHAGSLNDGLLSGSADDWDKEDKPESWWGYAWPRLYTMDTLAFTSGALRDEGGWFREPPRVQVRQDGRWMEA